MPSYLGTTLTQQLCIDSLGIPQSSFVNHDRFLLPFPILTLFISFAYLNALTRASRTVHQSNNSGHPYLISDQLIGFSNDSNTSPLRMSVLPDIFCPFLFLVCDELAFSC